MRYGIAQIITMLRRADVELGKGKRVPEDCKRLGISQQTYYRWRKKYCGMAPEMAKELKALQKENARQGRPAAWGDDREDATLLVQQHANRSTPAMDSLPSRRAPTTWIRGLSGTDKD